MQDGVFGKNLACDVSFNSEAVKGGWGSAEVTNVRSTPSPRALRIMWACAWVWRDCRTNRTEVNDTTKTTEQPVKNSQNTQQQLCSQINVVLKQQPANNKSTLVSCTILFYLYRNT